MDLLLTLIESPASPEWWTWVKEGQKCWNWIKLYNYITIKTNLIKFGQMGSSSNITSREPKPSWAYKSPFFPSLSQALLKKSNIVWAQLEPSSDFDFVSKSSLASPAQAFWLEPVQARAILLKSVSYPLFNHDHCTENPFKLKFIYCSKADHSVNVFCLLALTV